MTDETWLEELIGATLIAVKKHDGDLDLETDRGLFRCEAEGACCAYAFVESIECPDLGGGAAIIKGWHKSCRSEESKGEYIDFDFYCIQTTAGYVDIELRTEHNGYYCGWLNAPHEVV